MTSLINKIGLLIKREKTTPEKKQKDDSKKTSSEILSELFGAFNADPPKIDEAAPKKSKKSKKKHKKEKKKRSRSSSSSSSDDSDYSHKRKKRKKSKSKRRKDADRSPSHRSRSPLVKIESDAKFKVEKAFIKSEDIKFKVEPKPPEVKSELKDLRELINVKREENNLVDASLIPMPASPKNNIDDGKDTKNTETEKSKGKIQIKNLKFSAVFEETVKQAEEEARKKAEKNTEDGEYTDSSSESVQEVVINSHFPKSSDPGGILKRKEVEENKVSEEAKIASKKTSQTTSSHKSSHKESDKSKEKERSKSHRRSRSKTRRSRSRSASRKHRSSSKSRRRSRSRHRSRSRRRSRSRNRGVRHHSPRHRGRRSRSASGVKLADSEKKRLLEVARRNAINMLKNGAVPAGAAALPPHTRSQVMAAIQSGGKSVDELTDFCKHLSKKEALGELSSVSSNDDDMSENEDTLAFHHPFLVKEKAPIVMNIRGGAPLPIKSTTLPIANKEELRLQFPVSSGTQHRETSTEWVPVSPKKDNMQVAKLNSKPSKTETPASEPSVVKALTMPAAPLALPAPPTTTSPTYMKSFTTGSPHFSVLGKANSQLVSGLENKTELSPVALPALPAPGPQAYPPGIDPPKIDMALIVSQKIAMIRKEQEQNEITGGSMRGVSTFGWRTDSSLGQFTGSTGAHILTPRELASGTQAWAKKDQLVRAAPVEGGMGMHLLQKMGWTPGQGLGKEGTGTLQPLLLEVKLDTKGLTSREEVGGRHNKGVKPPRHGRGRGAGAAPLVAGGKHPVSLLGEYCSKQKLGPPEYNLCFECGPDHKKNFLFKVKVAGTEYQPAVASANKKQAKADAAQMALQKLGILT